MSTFGRYTGRLHGLSAITGERLEYYVPEHVYALMGHDATMGLCMTDQMATAMFRGTAQIAQRTHAIATQDQILGLTNLRNMYERELEKLRQRGVKGQIPVCLYPVRGSGSATVSRSMRRAVPIHERFHAEMRRLEHRLGDQVVAGALGAAMRKLSGGDDAMDLSFKIWGGVTEDRAAEEILARVEELRKSCQRSTVDCEFIERAINNEATGWETRTIKRGWMVKLLRAIIKKHGGGLAFASSAYRAAPKPKRATSEADRFWEQNADADWDF